ncbi:MAG: hypothetical protein SFU87_09400, partial [Chitinophagaceae bacterium]|nr:hypothetical protein [Chitinophagaceae bacterium]
LGAKMVKNYRDAFGDDNMRFVGKNIIENILSQPGCVGVSIYDALEEDGRKTFVIVGIGQDGLPILEYQSVNKAGDIEKKEGIVADRSLGWVQFGLDQGF